MLKKTKIKSFFQNLLKRWWSGLLGGLVTIILGIVFKTPWITTLLPLFLGVFINVLLEVNNIHEDIVANLGLKNKAQKVVYRQAIFPLIRKLKAYNFENETYKRKVYEIISDINKYTEEPEEITENQFNDFKTALNEASVNEECVKIIAISPILPTEWFRYLNLAYFFQQICSEVPKGKKDITRIFILPSEEIFQDHALGALIAFHHIAHIKTKVIYGNPQKAPNFMVMFDKLAIGEEKGKPFTYKKTDNINKYKKYKKKAQTLLDTSSKLDLGSTNSTYTLIQDP